MSQRSYNESTYYRKSRISGSVFESSVLSLVHSYTHLVWHNIRIETLLTQTGSTELDIVCYIGGTLYLLELKRVRKIIAEYSRPYWTMYGWLSESNEASEYTTFNVIEQNNIHARSLSDLYFSVFKDFLQITPIIVVPDNCEFPDELMTAVLRVRELESLLISSKGDNNKDITYRLLFLLDPNAETISRKDFVNRKICNSEIIRGRKDDNKN